MRSHKGGLNWLVSGRNKRRRRAVRDGKDTQSDYEAAICVGGRDAYTDIAESAKFGMKTNRASSGHNRERESSFSEIAVSREPNYRQPTTWADRHPSVEGLTGIVRAHATDRCIGAAR
jgi:hypothetical protein